MDANGTHFHLFLGRDDWSRCADEAGRLLETVWEATGEDRRDVRLAWDEARGELTLERRLFRFVATPNDRAPAPRDRRGAAGDRFGNIYWIEPDEREVRVYSSGSRQSEHFWATTDQSACPRPPSRGAFEDADPVAAAPRRLRGLTVTEEHFLVVGVLDPPGLLIFDLHAEGLPQQILWPLSGFAPFDMAARPGGGVWILDRDPAPGHPARYWAVDRHFAVVTADQQLATLDPGREEDFQPADAGAPRRTAERVFPRGVSLDDASPLVALDAIAIEGLPDGSVLILEARRVHRWRDGAPTGAPMELDLVRQLIEADFTLLAHDFVFVPAKGPDQPDRLYVASTEGNQVYAFDLVEDGGYPRLEPVPEFLPMRLFGGKALVVAAGSPYYDFDDRWLPLVAQKRPRYKPEGVFFSPLRPGPVLDGREPDCVWHRLILDACLPPRTKIEIWSRAANDARALAGVTWQREPDPYRRRDGCEELPFARTPFSSDSVARATAAPRDGAGTWEALFQNARGQYLQLKLRLTGDGRVSPRLKALRVYYPRFSYLHHYLPTLYREDPVSASFLERLLANFEGFYTALEDRIAAVQVLFDPDSTPAEALEWLAHWFEVVLDPAWDEARRRLFLKHTMRFFQWRGTLRGIRTALALALSKCVDEALFTGAPTALDPHGIRVVEKFRLRRSSGVAVGDPTEPGALAAAPAGARWQPSQGAAAIRELWADALAALSIPETEKPADFPVRPPSNEMVAGHWREFARVALGFVPAVTEADRTRWTRFLIRRYHRIDALNAVYGSGGGPSFEHVPLPQTLPTGDAPLRDWYDFERVVVAMHRAAHEFRVLLPMPEDDPSGEAQRQRLALATRIVELEKPAHTVFDVRSYWALFRVGEVRLGEETLIDLGSRSPELLSAMRLGRTHLAEGYLEARPPANGFERRILDRDRLAARSRQETPP